MKLVPVYKKGRLVAWARVDDDRYAELIQLDVVADASVNIQNRRGANRGARSQYRGVSYCKQTKRWIATATVNRVCHWLGRHDTEEQAAAVAADFRAKHMPGSREFVETRTTKEAVPA